MHYKKLWTDLHSNIHHNQMGELNQWIEHAKKTVDFWPVAYYPFYMKRTETQAWRIYMTGNRSNRTGNSSARR